MYKKKHRNDMGLGISQTPNNIFRRKKTKSEQGYLGRKIYKRPGNTICTKRKLNAEELLEDNIRKMKQGKEEK